MTCDRCLQGNHRCLDLDCTCTHCGGDRRPTRTVARPRKRTRARTTYLSTRPVGRPRRDGVQDRQTPAERAAMKREGMRRLRADEARERTARELAADPSGRTWSIGTRRMFQAETNRLGTVIHG